MSALNHPVEPSLVQTSGGSQLAEFSAPSRLFVITLGRARPGFDQAWSAHILSRCVAHLTAQYQATIESETIKSPARLKEVLLSPIADAADLILFLQPSIADGVLVNAIAQHAEKRSLLFWATPERPEGNIVSSNSLVGTHLFVATLAQYGVQAGFVCGDPDDPVLRQELSLEVAVLSAVRATRCATVGLIGSHAPGFIDLHVDPRYLSASTGATLEQITMHQFFEVMDAVSDEEIALYTDRLRQRALPVRDITDEELPGVLAMQARYWAAYCKLMRAHDWQALALRCWPDLPQKYGCWPYLAVSMMLADGQAVAIEGDVDAAISTMAARWLAPGGVYLSDWLEHDARAVVLWHGGAIDPALCVGDSAADNGTPARTADATTAALAASDGDFRAHIAPHFNSKTPAVIEGDIQAGRSVTLWRVWQSGGVYRATALQGQTTAPRQHFRGTTARIECQTDDLHSWLRDKLRHAMPHHILMVTGHRREVLKRYAQAMGWEWVG